MKTGRRFLTVCLASFLLTLVLGTSAFAEGKISIEKRTLWADCEYFFGVTFNENMPERAKLVSVKSSNPSVIRAELNGTGIYDSTLYPLKPGKSKITVTYKLDGKKYKVSATHTVKKYPAPYSYIKVNGKKINLSETKYYYDIDKYKKTSAKIQIKLKKGWKIADAYGYD